MNRKKNLTLGLHTLEEQSIALRMATGAFETAMKGISEGSREQYAFGIGYISAIADLAQSEGAHGLLRDLERMSDQLKAVGFRW